MNVTFLACKLSARIFLVPSFPRLSKTPPPSPAPHTAPGSCGFVEVEEFKVGWFFVGLVGALGKSRGLGLVAAAPSPAFEFRWIRYRVFAFLHFKHPALGWKRQAALCWVFPCPNPRISCCLSGVQGKPLSCIFLYREEH